MPASAAQSSLGAQIARDSTRRRTESEKLQAQVIRVDPCTAWRTDGVLDHERGPPSGPLALKLGEPQGLASLDWRTAERGSKLFPVACVRAAMVAIAQSVEHRVVVAGAAGSSPVSHPIVLSRDIVCIRCRDSGFFVSSSGCPGPAVRERRQLRRLRSQVRNGPAQQRTRAAAMSAAMTPVRPGLARGRCRACARCLGGVSAGAGPQSGVNVRR